MTRLLVRDATESDRDGILAVTLAAYVEYAAILGPYWDAYRHDIVATLGAAHPADQFVAEWDSAVAGAVLLIPAGAPLELPTGERASLPLPEVRLLAVAPAARRHGLGEALIRACARRARQAGAAALGLHTVEWMQAAGRLYERLGFVRAPEADFHPAPGVTIKAYRLELESEDYVR
jgi:GNAT superfamily N-acetyltransferase